MDEVTLFEVVSVPLSISKTQYQRGQAEADARPTSSETLTLTQPKKKIAKSQ